MRSTLTLALAAVMCATAFPGQTIYGLKSTANPSQSSIAPARLFSFDGSSGAVTDIAWVTYQGQTVDADGLAFGEDRLFGFLLDPNGSRLVDLDRGTGVATSLAYFQGAQMRGATYRDGNLYALDVMENVHRNLATIDLSTYGATFVPIDTRIANGDDLDFDASGTLWVAESNAFHTLDPITGALTFVSADGVVQPDGASVYNVGFAFDESLPGRAVTLEANGTDDLNSYLMPSPLRTGLNQHIYPSFNAGRGDLAAVPEPCTMFALGLGALAFLRRRR